MLFNSLHFLIFFPIVFITYFQLPFRWRWALLLVASYYFYMCWKPSYGLILLSVTVADFWLGIFIEKSGDNQPRRRLFISLSLLFNLGLLAYFKYVDFFLSSFNDAFAWTRWDISFPLANVILPIGISFHIFQSLSYTIDVYRGKQKAERHLGYYALYVAYFPQLVAGPIERSTNLMPQLHKSFSFDYDRAVTGTRLMMWGFFKKLVVADKIGITIAPIFDSPVGYQAFDLILATYLFAIQIYCDFSGYTDIARGAARIMGHNLMENFRYPYAARSIGEFWTRWHISLSSWFKEYLYIPLGGNRGSSARLFRNILVVFLLSGLWHGANWTFVFWGGLHAIYMIGGRLTAGLRQRAGTLLHLDRVPLFKTALEIAITFHLVCLSWIFFRAKNMHDAITIVNIIWQWVLTVATNLDKLGGGNGLLGYHALTRKMTIAIAAIAIMEAIQFLHRRRNLQTLLSSQPGWLRWACYIVAGLAVLTFGELGSNQFIYFQF